MLEDGAALVGIGIAAIGTMANAWLGLLVADGLASIGIGLLLLINGTAILIATRSLIAGEAVAPPLLRDLQRAISDSPFSNRVARMQTLHLGPTCILIAITLQGAANDASDAGLQRELDGRLRAIDDRIIEVLFRYGDETAG